MPRPRFPLPAFLHRISTFSSRHLISISSLVNINLKVLSAYFCSRHIFLSFFTLRLVQLCEVPPWTSLAVINANEHFDTNCLSTLTFRWMIKRRGQQRHAGIHSSRRRIFSRGLRIATHASPDIGGGFEVSNLDFIWIYSFFTTFITFSIIYIDFEM